MQTPLEVPIKSIRNTLPEVGRHVIVVTKDYRCLGHVDFEGIWRRINGEIIRDVIDWESI